MNNILSDTMNIGYGYSQEASELRDIKFDSAMNLRDAIFGRDLRTFSMRVGDPKVAVSPYYQFNVQSLASVGQPRSIPDDFQ
jgi:hypothetical protein